MEDVAGLKPRELARIRGRLVDFASEVFEPMPRKDQRRWGEVYVRGLMLDGRRKSIEPMAARLEDGDEQCLQQFVNQSPWDWGAVRERLARRMSEELEPAAWIVDDTGIPKDGKHSPGVKRQYSGTLGKIGNCQIAVSVHALGERGSLPLGWALYQARGVVRRPRAARPGEDPCRTRVPHEAAACPRARPAGGRLGDPVRACSRRLGLRRRQRLPGCAGAGWARVPGRRLAHDRGFRPRDKLCGAGAKGGTRSHATVARPDRKPESVRALALRLPEQAWQRLSCRTTPAGEQVVSRFALVRVAAAHPVLHDHEPPRQEWLVVEWPEGEEAPCDYWLSNLPPDTPPERLARLARLRWAVELDYRQLKGELGLDHYEGRSYLGFHHHCALVTCAHAFLTLERLCPKALRPA